MLTICPCLIGFHNKQAMLGNSQILILSNIQIGTEVLIISYRRQDNLNKHRVMILISRINQPLIIIQIKSLSKKDMGPQVVVWQVVSKALEMFMIGSIKLLQPSKRFSDHQTQNPPNIQDQIVTRVEVENLYNRGKCLFEPPQI